MKPYEIIARLESTPGRLEKEQIIYEAWEAGCIEFFEGAKLAYDALITFGVKKVPIIEGDDDPNFEYSLTWSKFLDISTKLHIRKITGNTAKEVLRAAADSASTKEWNYWYRRILLKDLKCGITEVTINKVLESIGEQALTYIIPVFSCQLAKNADDHPKKISGKKYLDPKLDGVRIVTIIDIDNKTVTQYSRDGRQNDRFTIITEKLTKIIPHLKKSIVLDGEMVSRSFQELMKQLNRKEDVDTSDARLALFDILFLEDFRRGECLMTQTERQDMLVGLMPILQQHCEDKVYIIPKLLVDLDTVDGNENFKEFNRETVEAGYEGIMVKDPAATYKCKRTDAWLKIKPFITVDLEVIGVERGKPDSRFKDTLGGLVCKGTDQDKIVEVTVGSGYSEELRDEIWKNKDSVIGRIVEIKGDALTKAQDGETWSLRFPVFMNFRNDKS